MIPDLVVVALDFYRDPGRFGHLRDPYSPLPPGITDLLAAPARSLSAEQMEATSAALGAQPVELRECVPFFAKQVLLDVGGDYYRILGVSRDAQASLIKQHYHYLMRLFHPDKDVADESWDDLYAPRINEAYNTLRNPAKRAEYDASLGVDDGFNPGALRQAASEPDMRRPVGMVAEPVASQGLSPRARWVAVGLLVLVVVVFGVLVAMQNRQPALRLEEKAVVEVAERVPGRGDVVVRDGEVRFVGGASSGGSGVGAGAELSGGGSRPETAPTMAAASSDERVEAMVRQRVAQAQVAVLGSRAVPKVEARPQLQKAAPAGAQAEPAESGLARAVEEPASAESEIFKAVSEPARTEPELIKVVSEPVRTEPEFSNVVSEPARTEPEFSDVVSESAPAAPVEVAGSSPAGPAPHETVPAAIRSDEIESLLGQFVSTYQSGDAVAFAGLFATNADTTDARGRDAIRRVYAEFFARPETRRVRLEPLRWHEVADDARVGTAMATITVFPEDGSAPAVVEADITFALARVEGRLLITGMHY